MIQVGKAYTAGDFTLRLEFRNDSRSIFPDLLKLFVLGNLHIRKRQGLPRFYDLKVVEIN